MEISVAPLLPWLAIQILPEDAAVIATGKFIPPPEKPIHAVAQEVVPVGISVTPIPSTNDHEGAPSLPL